MTHCVCCGEPESRRAFCPKCLERPDIQYLINPARFDEDYKFHSWGERLRFWWQELRHIVRQEIPLV